MSQSRFIPFRIPGRFFSVLNPLMILCVIVVASSCIFYNHVEKTPFFGDESCWISSANYYSDLLFALDFDGSKWDGEQYYDWGSTHSLHATQLIIGIPLKIRSLYNKRAERFISFYDWKCSFEDNIKYGRVPQGDMLLSARKISVIFGILCCILVFGSSYYARNALIGTIAALLLMTNKLFILYSTRAMPDVYLNFFLLCFCLLFILAIKFQHGFSYLSLSVFGGMITGLATSVKIVGIVIGGMLFALICAIRNQVEHYKQIKRSFKYAVLFLFTAFITIILLNPNFWPSRTVRQYGHDEKYLRSVTDFARDIPFSNLFRPFNFFVMFRNINCKMNEHVLTCGSDWGENRFVTFHKSILLDYSNFPIEWVFLCSGIIYYIINIVRMFRKRRLEPWIIPFLYFIVNYLLILVFMKINWDRYYLPAVVASKFIVATGIYETGISFYNYLFKINNRGDVRD